MTSHVPAAETTVRAAGTAMTTMRTTGASPARTSRTRHIHSSFFVFSFIIQKNYFQILNIS